MRYMMIIKQSDEEALAIANEFIELYRIHWPEFTGESELRQFETGAPGSE